MTDHDDLSGRTALITGGTRGIGKGIADRLRAGGARVLVAARSMPEDASADQVVVADVATADGVAALAAEALERLGAIDIAVHNVGGSGQHDGGAATSPTKTGSPRWKPTCWRPSGWTARSS